MLMVVIEITSHLLVCGLNSLTIILQFPVEIAVILVLCYTGPRTSELLAGWGGCCLPLSR